MNSISDVQNLKMFSMNEAWNFVIFFSFFVFSLRPVAFRGVAFQKRAFQTRIFCFPLFFASPVQYRAVPYDWKTDVLHTVLKVQFLSKKLDFLKICKIKPNLICRKWVTLNSVFGGFYAILTSWMRQILMWAFFGKKLWIQKYYCEYFLKQNLNVSIFW